ncbi:MAG: sirohydrochlorin cobaltochelatase [Rikenellaceae bacterium]
MKKFIILVFLIVTSLDLYAQKVNFESSPIELKSGDKLAIVMVHFGSTNTQSRANYEAINSMVADKYSEADVFEAYSSRIVINLLKKQGVEKQTPAQLLRELIAKGYTHLVVQSTHIIDGVEMESLREDVRAVSEQFETVRVGNPLLYSAEDYKRVAEILTQEIEPQGDATILVGHGTYTPITASYTMMDYVLKFKGYDNWYVATIEGYPTIDEAIELLDRGGYKSVTLAPFMYIAGVHAQDDIAGEWKEALEERGYTVELQLKGMGESKEIQSLIVEHIDFAIENKHLNIMDKKKKYANEDD